MTFVTMLLYTNCLSLLAVLLSAAVATNGAVEAGGIPKWKSIRKSAVTGFFAQDLAATNESSFDYIKSNFGLLDEFQVSELEERGSELKLLLERGAEVEAKKAPWRKFERAIEILNNQAPRNTKYKVLYLARHGQGYHNAAETFYGTPLWDCYWSLQDGNGTTTWADAELTPEGILEAQRANAAWKTQTEANVPLPESFYSSPLSRAASTLFLTWQDTTLRHSTPIFKEKLRETLGIHTCDRRRSKTYLHETYPTFTFEAGFAETDPLWDPIWRESNSARDVRLGQALDEIFASDDATYVSITAHGGTVSSILNVIGHRSFRLQTGGMIPVVVKVEFVSEAEPTTTVAPGSTAPSCAVNPTASASP